MGRNSVPGSTLASVPVLIEPRGSKGPSGGIARTKVGRRGRGRRHEALLMLRLLCVLCMLRCLKGG